MKRPPKFIKITEGNLAEIRARARREPFVRNGLMCGPGSSKPSKMDTVAFPWPDVITELGQLAEEAEAELAGEPVPAWPISRLRLKKGDILVVRAGMPDGLSPAESERYLKMCGECVRKMLDKAGHSEEDVLVMAVTDKIELSVISGSENGE